MDSISIRRLTRESAMQYLYEAEIQKDFTKDGRTLFLSRLNTLRDYEKKEDNKGEIYIEEKFFNKIAEQVEINLCEIDQALETAAKNWKIERISKVDLAILRLSIAEIYYLEEIPDSVSINEAVELAKLFAGDKSSKFINGILGKVVKDKNLKNGKE